MEKLPDLPRNQVLSYLNVADLLACSLVNITWREAANSDPIWKNICYKTSNQATVDHLQAVHSTVTPLFEEPVSTNESLDPLCYWRVVYMKLLHVKRNWKKANHKTYRVTEMAYNIFDIKIDNDLLVANVNDNTCEVWEIRGLPKKNETIACGLKNSQCKCMINLCNNRLIIVQDTLLQIYTKNGKSFKLSFRRLFNQPEKVSKEIPGSLNIDEWYNEQVKCRPTHLIASHVGKYFIGIAENGILENSSFHVWDTNNGSKLKVEVIKDICPEIKDCVLNVKFCPSKSDLSRILVCVQHLTWIPLTDPDRSKKYYTVIYLYDLITLTFTKLQTFKPHVPWIYYENNLLITIDRARTKLSVFKTSNGEQIFSKQYGEMINPDSVQVHKGYLGFTTGVDLVVLSTEDFDLVFTNTIFKFSSNLFGFDFIFLDWDLVLISSWDEVNTIEVWNMKDTTILSTLQTYGLMFSCHNTSKFFVWNEMVTTIYMLQFW